MRTVTVKFEREDGKTFEIDDITWKIPEDGLIGFDFVTQKIKTNEKAFGDGSFFKGIQVAEKDRTIKAELMDAKLNAIMRETVRSFFGIKQKIKVTVNYDGNSKWCEGYVYEFAMPTKNIYDRLKFMVTILSPQPFLLSIDEFGKNIAETKPMFAFPYVSVINAGFNFSEFKFAKEVILENNGDVETNAKIVIRAKSNVINPSIKNGDYFIKINDTLNLGDEVVIDLTSEPPTVKKNKKSIMGKLDKNSDLKNMCLRIGDNKISFDADSGNNNMDVIVYYNKMYGGL